MYSPVKRRLIITLIGMLIILIGSGITLVLFKPKPFVSPQTLIMDQTGTGGPSGLTGQFNLMDENGVNVTQDTYAGQYKLIFFGFTHCPSICPTELLKIADIITALPADVAARITPLFITIDPARDTSDALKKYTDNFDPRIVGLTGTDAQIESAIDAFKVYAARVDTENPTDAIPTNTDATDKEAKNKSPTYTMDHSTFLYLFGPDHQLIKLYRMSETVEAVSPDLLNQIKR